MIKVFSVVFVAQAMQLFTSCTHVDESDMVGEYFIDKWEYRDSSLNAVLYPILSIKKDNRFELKESNGSVCIFGTWKTQKRRMFSKNNDISIEFYYDGNKIIRSDLKGTIFYFYYPNDFYQGKYNVVLYVKKW